MQLPTELSMLIQDFARPQTRGDWKQGSYLRRTCGYAALYWKTRTGFWYEMAYPDDVQVSIYMYAWTTSRIGGVNLLLGLWTHGPVRIVNDLFDLMTAANTRQLAAEVHYFDPDISLMSDKTVLRNWLFG